MARPSALAQFADGWTVAEDMLRPTNEHVGVLFTTSNGYLGVRGRRREPFGDDGLVLLSGCHETRPYAHPETSFAIPEHYQTMVAVTDPHLVSVTVDGVPMTAESGTWREHRRELDLRTGCVSTVGTWCAPTGPTLRVRSRRLASLVDGGVLWNEVELDAVDGPADIELVLTVRANTATSTFPDEPEALGRAWGRVFRPRHAVSDGDVAGLVHVTALSGRAVACVAAVYADDVPVDVTVAEDEVTHRLEGRLSGTDPLRVTQRTVFADGDGDDAVTLLTTAAQRAAELCEQTFDDALTQQRVVLDEFWEAAAVELEGATDIERAVRFATFQTFQASARKPVRAAPSKGLTGQGYEGHQLWDQEIYVGHVLTLLAPEAARAGVHFRVRTLPQARARAARLSHAGAQYPWRTIDGTEASAFFPAGTAQHHINADIAWAIDHYVACTGDDALLREGGLEVLVETARLWMSLGRFDEQGRFRIEGVTGPDEYTALVDNNLYTNLMAARNLRSAAARVGALASDDPGAHHGLVDSLGLEAHEPERWGEAADAIVVPYDETLGVHGQDDSFLRLPRWDLEATPPEQFPLQDHHHLLTLYRHQVLKQADVVLALFLLADHFTDDEQRRAFEHYEPLTAHDSSLSAAIHAVVAARLGDADRAWRYTRETLAIDLEDRKESLGDGLHLAAAAGGWLAVACGIGGFAVRRGRPYFRPWLPPGVTRLCFRLRFRAALIQVAVDADAATYRLLRGGPVELEHGEEVIRLDPGGAAVRAARDTA